MKFPTPPLSRNKIIAVAAVILIMTMGYVFIQTRASGFFASVDPSGATLTGNAQLLTESDGSKSIRFNAPATTPPPTPPPTPPSSGPRSCSGKPDASCTGVTPGTVLSVVNGDITYGSSYNGQTISGKDFRGIVTVTGSNITIRDSIFRGRPNMNANNGILNTINSTGTITVMDVEVDNTANPSVWMDGMWLKNTNVYRAHVHHGVVDGIKTAGNVLIEESYIHDMQWFSSDVNQGGGPTHNDGVQSYAGPANTTLRRNNINMASTKDANAAWQNSSPNSRAEGNWLNGGACTLNFSHAGQPILEPMYVINNRFGRDRFYEGCVILISTKTVLTQYTGNVWDDTGAAVPSAQQHD